MFPIFLPPLTAITPAQYNSRMNAVIYARYSSDNQREESIEGQIRECTAYAEKSGVVVVHNYIDRAYSAKTDNRPQFQEMVRDSAKKGFEMVIVWKLDRFARNRYDSARYKAALRKNGVRVVSATESISQGPEGIVLEAVLEGYAEYYSAELSQKVVRGMTDNILKGMSIGGSKTFGYRIGEGRRFESDPLAAPIVGEIFSMYMEGFTIQQISDTLNRRGIRNATGHVFGYNNVRHILSNRRYIGELSFRDVVVPDAIPAIVSSELFNAVQTKLAANKKAPAKWKADDEYLLTTKLFCGTCGSFMTGEAGTSKKGVVHHYYRCVNTKLTRNRRVKTCDKRPVKKKWIEDLVIQHTQRIMDDDELISDIIDKVMEIQQKEKTDLPLLEKQLADIKKSIENIVNAIQAGIFNAHTKTRLDELDAAQKEMEARIAEEKIRRPILTRDQVELWMEQFKNMDLTKIEHRRLVIDVFVNAVYLFDDRLLITYNYHGGTETIPLSQAAEAANDDSNLNCLGAPIHDNLNTFSFGDVFGLLLSF